MVDQVNNNPTGAQDLALLLDRFVRRLHLTLSEKAKEFDTKRVGPWGAMVLLTLDDLGPVPIHTLTETLLRDKSQMTRSLQTLEAKGVLTRTPSTRDNRVTIVALTDAGRATVAAHKRALAETIDEILGPLPEADGAALCSLLTRVLADETRASP